MIGTNDAPYDTTAEFESKYRQLVDIYISITPEVYCVSILPQRTEWEYRVEEWNPVIKQICAEKGVTYIDVFESIYDGAALKLDLSLDELHLNTSGQQLWLSLVKPVINP